MGKTTFARTEQQDGSKTFISADVVRAAVVNTDRIPTVFLFVST